MTNELGQVMPMVKYLLIKDLPMVGKENYVYLKPVPETDSFEEYIWNGSDFDRISLGGGYQMAKRRWDWLFEENYPLIEEIIYSGKDWTVEIKAI